MADGTPRPTPLIVAEPRLIVPPTLPDALSGPTRLVLPGVSRLRLPPVTPALHQPVAVPPDHRPTARPQQAVPATHRPVARPAVDQLPGSRPWDASSVRFPEPVGYPAALPAPPAAAAAPAPASGAATADGPGASQRGTRFTFALVLASLVLVLVENTVLTIGLPTIQRSVHAGSTQILWSLVAYLLTFTAALYVWSMLARRYGVRPVYLAGIALVVAGSVGAATVRSASELIGVRTLLGFGGAAILPMSAATVSALFPPERRAAALRRWGHAATAALPIGPVAGGILIRDTPTAEHVIGNSWGLAFLAGVPLLVLCFVRFAVSLPRTRGRAPSMIDSLGGGLVTAGLLVAIGGLLDVAASGSWRPSTLGTLAYGCLLSAVVPLVRHAGTSAPPGHVRVVSAAAPDRRRMAAYTTAAASGYFAFGGIGYALTYNLQVVQGFSPLVTGLCFLPFSSGYVILSLLTPRLVRRVGVRTALLGALAAVAVAQALRTGIVPGMPFPVTLALFFLFGGGVGATVTAATGGIRVLLAGRASDHVLVVQQAIRQASSAVGVAVLGTLMTVRYTDLVRPMSERVLPPDASATLSRSAMAAADTVQRLRAGGLTAVQGDAVLDAARDALGSGCRWAAGGACGAAVLAAVAVALLLRGRTPTPP